MDSSRSDVGAVELFVQVVVFPERVLSGGTLASADGGTGIDTASCMPTESKAPTNTCGPIGTRNRITGRFYQGH